VTWAPALVNGLFGSTAFSGEAKPPESAACPGWERARVIAIGHQLVFWQRDGGTVNDARAVYEDLIDGREVVGLRTLPIDDIASAILATFPTAVRGPNGPSEWIYWVSTDERSSFEVEWSRQHVSVEMRPLNKEIANCLIDIMCEFRCPLYDPQTNERFDSNVET
jgi:hypothetical protein